MVSWWRAQSARDKTILGAFVLFVIYAIVSGGQNGSRTGPPQPSPSQVTSTSTPTSSPSTPSAAIASPAPAAAPDVIVGFVVANVTMNLERRGFRCEGPRQLQTLASWTCRGSQGAEVEFLVDVLGASPTRVRSINASVIQSQAQPSDAIAAEFLGFVATVPYTDAEPQRAREWVAANIARSDATMTIGTARFTLSKAQTGRAHTLDIVAVGAR